MLSRRIAQERLGRRRLMQGLMGGGLLLAAAPLAACGAQVAPQAAAKVETKAGAATTSGPVIEMNDQNKFVPETLTVAKGTTVTFKNVGMLPHNIVTDPAKAANKAHAKVPAGVQVFDSGMVNGGRTWSYTFNVAGEYKYFCLPHEMLGMVGTVTVTE